MTQGALRPRPRSYSIAASLGLPLREARSFDFGFGPSYCLSFDCHSLKGGDCRRNHELWQTRRQRAGKIGRYGSYGYFLPEESGGVAATLSPLRKNRVVWQRAKLIAGEFLRCGSGAHGSATTPRDFSSHTAPVLPHLAISPATPPPVLPHLVISPAAPLPMLPHLAFSPVEPSPVLPDLVIILVVPLSRCHT